MNRMTERYAHSPKWQILALAVLIPHAVFAQEELSFAEKLASLFPEGIDPLLFLGGIMLVLLLLLLLFALRSEKKAKRLKSISTELDQTRQRLLETQQILKETESNFKANSRHHKDTLNNAQIGIFQMDASGKCIYINQALQEISGLYPKKALRDGLLPAIHPEDRDRFNREWKKFIESRQVNITIPFRFLRSKDKTTPVLCRANKLFDPRKNVEGYVGWISDLTQEKKMLVEQETRSRRYIRFIQEAVGGYFHLSPDEPVPLVSSPHQMAKSIMLSMSLENCNEDFADLYDLPPKKLRGSTIDSMQGGCGPFKNVESIQKFIEAGYKWTSMELIRQDTHGNRIYMLCDVIGQIENDHLVGIWGTLRNISKERYEKSELSLQLRLLRRILDTLPVDIFAKDVRCKYLYANQKLSTRTGIPREDWHGKTINQLIQKAPKDYDRTAFKVMKTGQLIREEHLCEIGKDPEWKETIQIPLISDEGIVEGLAGLSINIDARKEKEKELQKQHHILEEQIKRLEERLRKQKTKLEKEAHKHTKWEEEIHKIEGTYSQLDGEIAKRKKLETLLETTRNELGKYRKEFGEEHSRREQIESHLKKARTLMENTRMRVANLTTKLNKEISTRKTLERQLAEKTAELEKCKKHSTDSSQPKSEPLKTQLSELQQTDEDLGNKLEAIQKALHHGGSNEEGSKK